MAVHYSDQVIQLPAYCTPPGDRVAPGDQGKLRTYRGTFTVPTATVVIAEVVNMIYIESICRIYLGNWWNTAMSSAGADASIQWGLTPGKTRTGSWTGTALVKGTNVPGYFLGTTSVDAIVSGTNFAVTLALGADELLYPGDMITCTSVTEAWVAAGQLVCKLKVTEV